MSKIFDAHVDEHNEACFEELLRGIREVTKEHPRSEWQHRIAMLFVMAWMDKADKKGALESTAVISDFAARAFLRIVEMDGK